MAIVNLLEDEGHGFQPHYLEQGVEDSLAFGIPSLEEVLGYFVETHDFHSLRDVSVSVVFDKAEPVFHSSVSFEVVSMLRVGHNELRV